jgi:hypothetical protein
LPALEAASGLLKVMMISVIRRLEACTDTAETDGPAVLADWTVDPVVLLLPLEGMFGPPGLTAGVVDPVVLVV